LAGSGLRAAQQLLYKQRVPGSVISDQFPLVLGSASPRRREMLLGLGIAHIVRPAHVLEDALPEEKAEPYVERIVRDKLHAVQHALASEGVAHAAVLVADTTVVVDGEVLGKPTGVRDAFRLLRLIAGRSHEVLTRYAIAAPGQPSNARTVRSEVTLRAADEHELMRYAKSGEGLDKAGAYAVQGLGAFLVRSIQGSWSNVVGLPACELVEDLLTMGLLQAYPAGVHPEKRGL